MYEFCYNQVKPKHGEKSKLYYMDAYSLIVYIKTDDIYKDIEEDVAKIFDASSYESDRPLSAGNN